MLGKPRLLSSCLVVLALAAADLGCMFSPFDGSTVESRFKPVLFQGYAEDPGVMVKGEIQRSDNQAWDPLFVTYASSTPEVDATGKPWYLWSTTLARLPTRGVYWPATGPGTSAATIRAAIDGVYAYTYTQSQFTCTVGDVAEKGYMAAGADCGVSKTALTLNAPCDAQDIVNGVSKGCYDAPKFAQIVDYPFDRSMDFSNGLQGVAHDDANWFFASAYRNASDQHSRIGKAPVGSDLNNQPFFYGNPYAPGHKHFGDPVHVGGIVYVPLEIGDGNATTHALGRFRASDLAYYPALPLLNGSPQAPSNKEFPWIAYNGATGRFYSSAYTQATGLYEYSLTDAGLSYQGFIPFSATIDKVQGGEFSANGRLYLSANTKNGVGGLVTVDVSDPGRALILGWTQPTWDPSSEELEGLTVWDLDGGQAPGIGGQIHMVMIQPEVFSNDDWYFKHFRADLKSKL